MPETILESTITAMTGWPCRSDDCDINLNAQMLPKPCPRQHRHVSGFPGYGRERCQCGKFYINK